MTQSGQLQLTISVLDDHSRQVGPVPVIQSWSPTQQNRSVVSLTATDWTQLTIPTGTTLLLLLLGAAFNLRLNFEEGPTASDGIPLAATDSGLGLPAVIPLGDSPVVWVYNGEDDAQEIIVYTY